MNLMSNQEPPGVPAKEHVPWDQLVVYGMGGMIPIALFNSVGLLVTLLGNITLGLNALMLGIIMVIPKLWDAFADPFIGHFSDNTRTRWGRRRPYILLGGIAVALTFVALWWIPRGESVRELFTSENNYRTFQLAYILGVLLLFYTAVSTFEIPHGALGMEMGDYHGRTRLFSAKSFLGNTFAIATPWMFALANSDLFKGTGGDEIDGMRFVSIFVAALLIPLVLWWFSALSEPAFVAVKKQRKSTFRHDMKKTVSSRSFLILVSIVFTLAMGFNFVQIFNYYITIFYLYGGDTDAAKWLLGWGGTAWAVTGLVAVFPLNWLSQWLGKNKTLLIAIMLMCAAQISKVVCYDPGRPYLVLIPTMLLSAGMLMFFTLGSSMVGDVADEDELKSGTRSEGSFYSVYWWIIQMGTAFASVVMGALLVFSAFDERQNVTVEAIHGSLERIKAAAEPAGTDGREQNPQSVVNEQMQRLIENSDQLRLHLAEQVKKYPEQATHLDRLVEHHDSIRSEVETLRASIAGGQGTGTKIVDIADRLLEKMPQIRQQSPTTLLRLRVIEISVPLALSVVSILLTLRYPLTEARCYEIKQALKERHAPRAS
jgi:GPH family glycoside/pentoside/hexuronide:cation symporter